MPPQEDKAVAIGINHVALEVGDIEEALTFYGALFKFTLRGREEKMAFIDLGDQFLALAEGRNQRPDAGRHFGMVVDNREAVRREVVRLECEILPSPFPDGLDFLDPWGNHLQIVEYKSVQFSKTEEVLRGMGLGHLQKTERTRDELRSKFVTDRD
jgi:catechol 2,3-dioxygenase-like lactoylglutathione lyase family enzyme